MNYPTGRKRNCRGGEWGQFWSRTGGDITRSRQFQCQPQTYHGNRICVPEETSRFWQTCKFQRDSPESNCGLHFRSKLPIQLHRQESHQLWNPVLAGHVGTWCAWPRWLWWTDNSRWTLKAVWCPIKEFRISRAHGQRMLTPQMWSTLFAIARRLKKMKNMSRVSKHWVRYRIYCNSNSHSDGRTLHQTKHGHWYLWSVFHSRKQRHRIRHSFSKNTERL